MIINILEKQNCRDRDEICGVRVRDSMKEFLEVDRMVLYLNCGHRYMTLSVSEN